MNLTRLDEILVVFAPTARLWSEERLLRDRPVPMQRNSVAPDDPPDVRYWTAYDYFMVDREARARRRARRVAAMVRKLQSLKDRIGIGSWETGSTVFRREGLPRG